MRGAHLDAAFWCEQADVVCYGVWEMAAVRVDAGGMMLLAVVRHACLALPARS